MNLEKNQIANIVSFFRIVCNLKKIKREGWIHKSKIDSPESVADHSYSMCTISMVLADILNLQTEHIMKMANLHDLAESLVGDKMPDSISREKKALVEGKAMKIILSKLPGPLREKYLDIWNEYVDNSTDSAKFVHNMDKLEMAVQAKEYEFDGYSKQLLQVFLKSANDYIAKSEPEIVFEILQKVNDNSK